MLSRCSLASAALSRSRSLCAPSAAAACARAFVSASPAAAVASPLRHLLLPAPRLRRSQLLAAACSHRVMSRSIASRGAKEAAAAASPTEDSENSVATSTSSAATIGVFDEDAASADQRFWFTVAGLSGSLAVALGAFGAHGLKARVTDTYYLTIWETAAHYHLVHALALAAAPIAVAAARRHRAKTGLSVWASLSSNLGFRTASAVVARGKAGSYRNWSARCFLFGTVVFSGSLYALTLTENKKWGAVTPFGGVGLILGWLFLAVGL